MKTLLALLILIPLYLSASEPADIKKFGDWTYSLHIDDFTDVKTHMAQTQNYLGIGLGWIFREPGYQSLLLKFDGYYCDSESRKEIPVLFRVDKTEVITLIMHPKENDRTELILKPNENDLLDTLINLQFKMMDGNILKIRVDDPKCEYSASGKLDIEQSLNGFTDSFKPIFKVQAKALGIVK